MNLKFGLFAALVCSAITAPAWAAVNAADFGVSESSPDNAEALERAFVAGKGQEVILPAGTLRYGREVRADSVRVRGSSGTVLTPTNPESQRIYLTGNGPGISNVRVAYKHIRRCGSCVERAGVWVEDASGFTIKNVHLDGAAFGKTQDGPGAGGGGILVRKSRHGVIQGNTINDTMADSVHITTNSQHIQVLNNKIERSGDDGVAVVNSSAGHVRVEGNTITNGRWGRGATVVGGHDVQIKGNTISGHQSDGAGVYVASEANYGTGAPKNVLVEGNVIQGTGGRQKGHGQIMLFNGGGAPSGVTIRDNDVRGSETDSHAVVLSGPMGGVQIAGNKVDGKISSRGGADWNGNNTTGTGSKVRPVATPPRVEPVADIGGSTVEDGDPPTAASPTVRRDDIPKARLPDISRQQADANAAAAKLGGARQRLTQATATRLPSMSMGQLRQQLTDLNQGDCN